MATCVQKSLAPPARRLILLSAKTFDPQLDIVSLGRYFGETAPLLALRDSTLFYACLACSPRVLTLNGEIDKDTGNIYEDRAIAELIARLSEQKETLHYETLAAITVILHMAEQFSEVQDDARCHLIGGSSIFASNPCNATIGAASFWVYVRQDIRASFLNEKPCSFDAGRMIEIVSAPATDAGWANKVTYPLTRTWSACWGSIRDSAQRKSVLEELQVLLKTWSLRIQETFNAWCNYRGENDVFSVISYISPWHGK